MNEQFVNDKNSTKKSGEQVVLNTLEKNRWLEVSRDKLSAKYVGKGANEHDLGSIKATKPLNSNLLIGYFEVTIESESSGNKKVAVGVATKNFSMKHIMPGHDTHSYAYHGDGKKYHENIGESYGSTFRSNDTIGCGINFFKQEIFFTRNAKYLGVGFEGIKSDYKYFPVGGLHSPGEVLKFNFGSEPFRFDIHSLIREENEKIMKEVNSYSISSNAIHSLIRDYLIQYAYFNTAIAFEKATSISPRTLQTSSLTTPSVITTTSDSPTPPPTLTSSSSSISSTPPRSQLVWSPNVTPTVSPIKTPSTSPSPNRLTLWQSSSSSSSTTILNSSTSSTSSTTSLFDSNIPVSPFIEQDFEIHKRKELRTLILEGKIKECKEKCENYYPGMISKSNKVEFLLLKQELIELIREKKFDVVLPFAKTNFAKFKDRQLMKNTSRPSFLSSSSSTSSSSYLQKETNSENNESNSEDEDTKMKESDSESYDSDQDNDYFFSLQDTMALMVYEKPEESEVGYLLSISQRHFVADYLNKIIMKSLSGPKDCNLEKVLKQLVLVDSSLKIQHNTQANLFPQIEDLKNYH